MFSFISDVLLRVKIPCNLILAGETNIERQIGQFYFRFENKTSGLGHMNVFLFTSHLVD